MESITLTIRLIRSFEHRNIRHLVLHGVDPQCTVEQLTRRLDEEIQKSQSLPPPFRKYKYNCIKINSYAHGSKTSDRAITLEHDEWILQPTMTLLDAGVCNETELSYFNVEDYDKYKANPQLLW